jgi:signal transduction histidine kinase
MSHEIRTPLALVKGSADLLLEETPGPLLATQREFVDIIRSRCEAVVEIAEGLLAQARAEVSLFDVQIGVVNLRRLVLEAVRDIRRLQAVPIRVDLPGPPPFILADSRLLKQALINLISNAVRPRSGTAEVVVHVTVTSDQVLMSVGDGGARRDLDTVVTVRDLRIDTAAMAATLRVTRLPLSATEFAMLLVLARNHGRVVSWKELTSQVWRSEPVEADRYVIRSAIYRLRHRLGTTRTTRTTW